MEPKARHILIGAFTVGILALAMAFALWLARLDVYKSSHRYVVHFKESVNGLSRGSSVLFSGIKVGEVLELSLADEDPRHVYALITVDSKVPVYEDVKARLQFMGVTGQSVISLRGGDPHQALLAEIGNFDKTYGVPIISAVPSPLSALLEDGQSVVSNLTEISYSLKNLFSDKNIKSVGSILSNVDGVTSAVSDQQTIKEMMSRTNTVLADLGNAIKEYDKLAVNANTMLTKEGQQALASATQAMRNLERTGTTIQRLVTNNEGNINQGLQGFRELTPAIIEFKRAFGTLQNILREMEDRPAGYFIDGNSLKGFKP
ncbi:MlaD family protein [Pelistega suis]|uniref:MlaD family protein n=1 Tax=Pelistega suis TaxID=1631957 RepID=UPI00211C7079|nr:MlaD family protein [Pelistega suis]MCQ9328222.1 MlaD family protein [Pelistega suis]